LNLFQNLIKDAEMIRRGEQHDHTEAIFQKSL